MMLIYYAIAAFILFVPSGLIAGYILTYLKNHIKKNQKVYYVRKKDKNGKMVKYIYYR